MLPWKKKPNNMKLKNIASFVVSPFSYSAPFLNKPSFILSSHIKDSSFQHVATDIGHLKLTAIITDLCPDESKKPTQSVFVLEKPLETKINLSSKEKFLLKVLA